MSRLLRLLAVVIFVAAAGTVARIRHLSLLATAVGAGLLGVVVPVLFLALAKLLDSTRGGPY